MNKIGFTIVLLSFFMFPSCFHQDPEPPSDMWQNPFLGIWETSCMPAQIAFEIHTVDITETTFNVETRNYMDELCTIEYSANAIPGSYIVGDKFPQTDAADVYHIDIELQLPAGIITQKDIISTQDDVLYLGDRSVLENGRPVALDLSLAYHLMHSTKP